MIIAKTSFLKSPEDTVLPPLSSPEKIRALVVEDTPDNQLLLSMFLSLEGISVDIAPDGRAGALKAINNNYDIVIMDIQLPEIDGIQATKMIREHGIDVPIIAHSAYSSYENRIKCEEAGCDDFLPKPIDRESLMRCINKYTNNNNLLKNKKKPSPYRISRLSPPQNALYKDSIWNRSIYKEDPIIGPLIGSFLRRIPQRLSSLEFSIQNNNLAEIKFLSHQIKGTFMGYGFLEDGKLLEEIEHCIDTPQAEELKNRMLNTIQELKWRFCEQTS